MQISSGELDSKIWIIGDAPGKQELMDKTPFASYSGKFLRDKLTYCGCDPDTVRMDYLYHKMPPKGDLSILWKDPDTRAELLSSIQRLKNLIRDCKPNLVILLGSQPLYNLAGKSVVNHWRGHVQWSDELGVKLLCTYHPTVALRQRKVPKKSHPGQYETLFMFDIKKALDNAKVPELTFDTYNTITKPTFTQAKDYLERALDEADILSYDIETDRYSVMDCISLCFEKDLGISIPFHILTEHGGLIKYWKSPSQASIILGLLKNLLESEVPKVAQNSQYDTVFIDKFYDIHVNNLVWDTMVAAHDLYSELPKDLGTLISLYTNIPYTKYLGKEKNLKSHWLYSATDAIANLHIMYGQFKECKELNVTKHYREVSHGAIMPCAWMQLEGVNVNEELRTEAIEVEENLQEEIIEALDIVFPKKINGDKKYPHKFNPGSSKDKLYLFENVLGCKLIYNKGSITFDKHALAKYMTDHRRYTALLAEAIRKYRLSQTMLGKLKTPLLEGRMHCAYYLGGEDETVKGKAGDVGTDTGRLNSKASIFDCGTNLQNLMKGIQRQMLIPDEGEGFLYKDLWAAEAFVTALDAGEPVLLDMLNAGIKIHQWMLEETEKVFPDECKKFEYTYKKAKQSVHAMNYGVQPSMMSRESGLPISICEWQYTFYHNKFPGIKLRQIRIENELVHGRKIKSLLGRQKVVIAPLSDEVIKQAYAWPSQSVIAEITLLGMTKLHLFGRHPAYPWCFPALNTHDGLITRYKLGEEDAVEKLSINAFNIPIIKGDLSITVPLSLAWAKNFNDMDEERTVRYE